MSVLFNKLAKQVAGRNRPPSAQQSSTLNITHKIADAVTGQKHRRDQAGSGNSFANSGGLSNNQDGMNRPLGPNRPTDYDGHQEQHEPAGYIGLQEHVGYSSPEGQRRKKRTL